MSKTIATFALKFIILILLQAVIFNNLVLFNTAVPLVFIYIIISMPVTWSTNAALTVGFLAGVAVDIFSNTQGVNALACTVLAFVRKPVFHLYAQHEEDLNGLKPSQRSMGSAAFLKYMSTMVLIYCALAFTIDAFAVFSVVRLAEQVLGSAIFTALAIYAIDTITTRQK